MSNVYTKENLLQPSAQFKKEVVKSIAAIVLFIVVYFTLFALSIGLVALCVYAGIAIITGRPSFYGILLGIGLMGFAVMVFFFLIKFLFTTNKADESDSIEITEEDQPQLFKVIHDLAKETGTSIPKKILLTPDVNASVSYNSSFWSMFLPIKKNLRIGLGLVNTINVSEFKAVVAHEFGHFSQRSMKLGSWVYQVNKIIFDMLYNNSGYANTINSVSGLNGIFSIFGWLTVQAVKGIQWVLQQIYKVVNKSYLSLSRQMEFHADLVASTACGSNNIINALKRIEFGSACYETTIELCNKALTDKKMADDFYSDHKKVITHLAFINNISLVNGLPVVINENSNGLSNRINYKDQWASHPTTKEREEYLSLFELTANVDDTSAWILFNDAEKWKKTLTKNIYRDVPEEEIKATIDDKDFENLMLDQFQKNSYPPVFKEYYNSRQIEIFDTEAVIQKPFTIPEFDAFLTNEKILLPGKVQYLAADIEILKAIANKEIDTNSFDFDGKKYARKQATIILAQLEEDLEKAQKELVESDQNMFRYFYAIAPLPEAEALKKAYNKYFIERKEGEAFLEKASTILQSFAPFYTGALQIETVESIISNFKQNQEPALKKDLEHWIEKGSFNEAPLLKELAQKFLTVDYQYFFKDSFMNNELAELTTILEDSWSVIGNHTFNEFKMVTQMQADILAKKESVRGEREKLVD